VLNKDVSRDERFERLCIEEYKVLRDESLRCAGIMANTIWIGTTQFVATVGVAAHYTTGKPFLQLVFLVLLCLESTAASVMFLSELWKYARVGRYIREKVEKLFVPGDIGDVFSQPMYWVNWIKTHRSRLFYVFTLIFLQLPIFIAFIILVVSPSTKLCEWIPEIGGRSFILGISFCWRLLLWILVIIDVIIIFKMGWRVKNEGKCGLNELRKGLLQELRDKFHCSR